MKKINIIYFLLILSFLISKNAIPSSFTEDSLSQSEYEEYVMKLKEIELKLYEDSIQRLELERKINALIPSDQVKHEYQQTKLENAEIDSLKSLNIGYPVQGLLHDTLFYIYTQIAESSPRERAISISRRIRTLYNDDHLKIDSIRINVLSDIAFIVYGETIIMGISEKDAILENTSPEGLAIKYSGIMKEAIRTARIENSLPILIKRISFTLLVFFGAVFLIWLIGKIYQRVQLGLSRNKEKWLKSLAYRGYTFLSAEQEYRGLVFVFKFIKWLIIAIIFYLTIPLIFSFFPFTRGWSAALFKLIWSPFQGIFIAIWNYLPNLFSILAIYFVMKYFIRFIKYIFTEIEKEKLKLSRFHADWAIPTFRIVRFLLYVFMFILIFPYLPGSDSTIFKGVSIFVGVLFSLGSSSAIANIIAGLVITYMRPFKNGDRIKIGEITGDVMEKTLLVTRIMTIKNEEITIPNSSILQGNTTNYTVQAKTKGLIIHTTLTLGYEVPWKDIYEALIEAALRTDKVLKDPKPFVLQTSLDDFYVAYQLNAYTHEASEQSKIYSNMHENIQNVCNEKGIEILSPHYRAQRDGNMTSIPADYLPENYKAPDFNVTVSKFEEKK